MATTALIALHKGDGKSLRRAFQQIIGYVKNPNKTENGKYVSGYACDPMMADAQFVSAKAEYIQRTGRIRGKDDVIAYHMRQAFAPGEITPEEANRLGRELAMRLTHGNNAFVVATHTDKHHIHNHIIFNAVNLECDRKFRDFKRSAEAIRRISDKICLENGYSIVENPKKPDRSHGKTLWMIGKNPPTQRDDIREAIDLALTRKPKNMEELLAILMEMGWQVKRGKHIALKKKDQKRFKRIDSLGDDYTEKMLTFLMENDQPHRANLKRSINEKQERRMVLLADIQQKMRDKNSPAYTRWSKVFYAKQMANTLLYMSENGMDDTELYEKASAVSAHCDALMEEIRSIESRMKEIADLRQSIFDYSKTRDVYREYISKKGKDREQFATEHAEEIQKHYAAKKAFGALKGQKIPTIKQLNQEWSELNSKKGKLYSEYNRVKKERKEMLTVKANLDLILGHDRRETDLEMDRKDRKNDR